MEQNSMDDEKKMEQNYIKAKSVYSMDDEKNKLYTDAEDTKFLLSLPRDIVAFTGEFEVNPENKEEYVLKTDLYLTGEDYNSKIWFNKDVNLYNNFIDTMYTNFWTRGWVHGDLDTSNITIQPNLINPNLSKFKIFDFEFITKYEYRNHNTVGFIKFIWSDIRKILKEYFNIYLVRNKDTEKCYWLIDECFGDVRDNCIYVFSNILSAELCNLLDKHDTTPINSALILQKLQQVLKDMFLVKNGLHSVPSFPGLQRLNPSIFTTGYDTIEDNMEKEEAFF